MKVIKQGKPKEEVCKKITCSDCDSELEYNNYDVVSIQDTAAGPLNEFVFCPVCSSRIKVE